MFFPDRFKHLGVESSWTCLCENMISLCWINKEAFYPDPRKHVLFTVSTRKKYYDTEEPSAAQLQPWQWFLKRVFSPLGESPELLQATRRLMQHKILQPEAGSCEWSGGGPQAWICSCMSPAEAPGSFPAGGCVLWQLWSRQSLNHRTPSLHPKGGPCCPSNLEVRRAVSLCSRGTPAAAEEHPPEARISPSLLNLRA